MPMEEAVGFQSLFYWIRLSYIPQPAGFLFALLFQSLFYWIRLSYPCVQMTALNLMFLFQSLFYWIRLSYQLI